VFKQLVLARIIEPTSKADSARVLTEAGVASASYATLRRRLPAYATEAFRAGLAGACAARAALGPVALVLFDVSTLYFETDAGDGFREPGFSKERRLDPQVTIGLLTDAGMLSRGNQVAIERAGLSFILGARLPSVPYAIAQWQREHPDQPVPDGLLLTDRCPPPARTGEATGGCTTATRTTGAGAPSRASPSRWARPRRRSRGRCR
jgi:hypothetical protein